MEDILILVDENDQEIGHMGKMEAHIEKKLHRAFSLFLYDKENDSMLIQRRAYGKYHSGGCWSNSCCSHPRKGEELPVAVVRRTKTELGIDILEEKLIYCGKFQYFAQFEKVAENEIDNVFVYDYSGQDKTLIVGNPEEVDSLMWIPLEELEDWLAREREAFSAWFPQAFAFALKAIRG
jgi:isopentenyl-diphosphate delta-isomerase type 1